jgi:hypothetical protein
MRYLSQLVAVNVKRYIGHVELSESSSLEQTCEQLIDQFESNKGLRGFKARLAEESKPA